MAAFIGKDVKKLKTKGGKWKYLTVCKRYDFCSLSIDLLQEKEMLDISAPFAPYRSVFMWYVYCGAWSSPSGCRLRSCLKMGGKTCIGSKDITCSSRQASKQSSADPEVYSGTCGEWKMLMSMPSAHERLQRSSRKVQKSIRKGVR